LAKDVQGRQVRLLFKDVAYDFPEALNDAWSADSPPPSLGGVIEMFNWFLARDALDGAGRDSRQTDNLASLVTGLKQDFDFVAP
jgi:hypothetical protein